MGGTAGGIMGRYGMMGGSSGGGSSINEPGPELVMEAPLGRTEMIT